jgi:uroporphyrinogen-III synthase
MMRILFTKSIDSKIVTQKMGQGFDFFCEEVIEIKPLKVSAFDLKSASLIFSSANAVKSFFENGFQPSEDFVSKNYNKIYCVGEKTKREVRKNGFGTFKVLRNAKELAHFIIEKSQAEKFLHFCGNIALDVLNETLPLQNISYEKIVIYNTKELNPKIEKNFDVLVFFSPSGVRSFAKNNAFRDCKIYSIGETTSDEVKKYTENEIITSQENSLTDVLELMKNTL